MISSKVGASDGAVLPNAVIGTSSTIFEAILDH